MENDTLDMLKIPEPLIYQKNKKKMPKKRSTDFNECKSIKNIYNNYNNNDVYLESYRINKSPIPKNLPFKKLKKMNLENDFYENINLDFKNLSSLFNINTNNIIDLPNFNGEKILDLNYENKSDEEINNILDEDEIPPICKYGLRYINYDIYNSTNDKIDKLILIQSFIRGFLLRKKIDFNLLNKINLENRNIKKIIFIQKHIRAFLVKLGLRKKIIMNYIKQSRKSAINIIIDNMRSYNNELRTKKLFFLKSKIEERNKYAKYIQETYRNYKFYNLFKKFMKEIHEKYSIIYPCKGNKVELIIYLEGNNILIPKKYTFYFFKPLKCFVLFINYNKMNEGKYKCQFIIDDIAICDKNYPYTKYKNELYNIIEFKIFRKKEVEKRQKRNKYNIDNIINKNEIMLENTKRNNYNRIMPNTYNNYQNKNFYEKEDYYEELEDIKDDENDENRFSLKYKFNKLKNTKNNYIEYIDDDLDFTEEDFINIKKLKGNNVIATDYQKLKEELFDKNPINKEKKIRKASFKSFNCNY